MGFGFIDPTVFIDDNGTPYLFWGNKGLWYGRLNRDMISFADGYREVPGYHDLYVLFRGGDGELFSFDWWKFNTKVNMPLVQTKYTADPAPMCTAPEVQKLSRKL